MRTCVHVHVCVRARAWTTPLTLSRANASVIVDLTPFQFRRSTRWQESDSSSSIRTSFLPLFLVVRHRRNISGHNFTANQIRETGTLVLFLPDRSADYVLFLNIKIPRVFNYFLFFYLVFAALLRENDFLFLTPRHLNLLSFFSKNNSGSREEVFTWLKIVSRYVSAVFPVDFAARDAMCALFTRGREGGTWYVCT